jgi:Family of unknown function (DUF5681)
MPNNLWQRGESGNPSGRPRGSRNKLTEAVVCALLRDFSKHGEQAIARVRRDQPGVYLKCLCLLLPRQDKLEHANTIKSMTDAELESAIAILKEMMEAQAVGRAHLIEMQATPRLARGSASGARCHRPQSPNIPMSARDTRRVGSADRQDLVACWIARYASRWCLTDGAANNLGLELYKISVLFGQSIPQGGGSDGEFSSQAGHSGY